MFDDLKISQNAAELLPAKKAFENNVLPISLEDNILQVGLANKNNYNVINDLSFCTGYRIKAVEMPAEMINLKLKELYPSQETNKIISDADSNNAGQLINEQSNVEFINQLISGAIKAGASDIHLEIYESFFRIRYRIDGHLREILNLPKERSQAAASRIKIMANLDISEKRRPQDGKIRFPHQNAMIDIRVSTLPTYHGEKIVLRILNRNNIQLDLMKLGLSHKQYEILARNISLPYGMILVTGPTGSGKTTTLYASLKKIHSIEKNIMTVEDPIEYNFEGINQTNVKPEIGFDFANALRSFLRQDPDVIMVGEIRDKETSEIAIRASLTGHLVFSTLHTNNSVSALTRLVDMGIEPFLVSSSVKLIIAQRLVRLLCNCKQENNSNDLPEGIHKMYSAKGCHACSYTGYKGRAAIFELLEVDEELAELITRRASVNEIKHVIKSKGFKSLRESGIEKINSGVTSYEEVLRETMV